MRKKTSTDQDNQTKQVTPSAPYLEDDDEHAEESRKDDVFDEVPNDSRAESSNVRFLGELKSDDSMEGEDFGIVQKKRGENVSSEQSISEKYIQGTLETDNETVKKHSTGRRESEDKRKQTESSENKPHSGTVHIGNGEEVRFSAKDEDNSENEDIKKEPESDKNGGKDSGSMDSGLGGHVVKTETQGDHQGTTGPSTSFEKTSRGNEKHWKDTDEETKALESKKEIDKDNEVQSTDGDSVDNPTLGESESQPTET